MLIYFLLLLVPLLASFAYPPDGKGVSFVFWLFFLVLLVFTGLRDEIGPDWIPYQYIFWDVSTVNLEDIATFSEPGFFLLNYFSDYMEWDIYGVMFVCALIFLFGVFSYATTTANPWMAIAVVTPYLVYIISMSGIRQAAAIGVGYFMLSKWRDLPIVVRLLLVGLAMTFHNSAAVFLFFFMFSGKGWMAARVILAAALALAIVFGMSDTETYAKYSKVYVEENLISGGAFFHVLLSAFPAAIYLIYRKQIVAAVGENQPVDLASIAVLAAMPLLAVSSTGVDRLTLYFSFIQMWIYPAIAKAFVAQRDELRLATGSLVLLIFFVYFLFGTHADSYVPYRSLLFASS